MLVFHDVKGGKRKIKKVKKKFKQKLSKENKSPADEKWDILIEEVKKKKTTTCWYLMSASSSCKLINGTCFSCNSLKWMLTDILYWNTIPAKTSHHRSTLSHKWKHHHKERQKQTRLKDVFLLYCSTLLAQKLSHSMATVSTTTLYFSVTCTYVQPCQNSSSMLDVHVTLRDVDGRPFLEALTGHKIGWSQFYGLVDGPDCLVMD